MTSSALARQSRNTPSAWCRLSPSFLPPPLFNIYIYIYIERQKVLHSDQSFRSRLRQRLSVTEDRLNEIHTRDRLSIRIIPWDWTQACVHGLHVWISQFEYSLQPAACHASIHTCANNGRYMNSDVISITTGVLYTANVKQKNDKIDENKA